ncbi:hypothetical protein JCM8202_003257 [Rhodotorula sphaerocarpa]
MTKIHNSARRDIREVAPVSHKFSSKARKASDAVSHLDPTAAFRDPAAWQYAHLATLGLGMELTQIAYDPVQSILAVGTQQGRIYVLGKPGVQLAWDTGYPSKIRHLAFRPGSGFLCAIDAKDTLYVYDLQRIDQGRPHRDSSLSLRANVTCIETSAAHSFLFIGGKDGTVDAYDLDRGLAAPHARIPNLWLEQEELLRRSGMPQAPSRRHIPVCIDIKTHPLNLHLLLIAYEGGVSLWNLATKQVERTWEFVLPPGAPGGGNDANQESLFAERRPAVTCLAWRPDGLLFAAGHEDGMISFAAIEDENPVMMRTIERADVNKATEEDLFGWGDGTGPGKVRPVAEREPIFRLAWSAFPQANYLSQAFGGSSSSGTNSPSGLIPSASSPAANDASTKSELHGGSVLTVLGGLCPSDPVGVHMLEFPAYTAPTSTNAKTGNMPPAVREALRESVSPSAHHLYPTPAAAEDFLLLPRSSPHYGGAYDPTSIIITSGRDPRCPVLPAQHSALNVEAFTFPPSSGRAPKRLSLPAALSFTGNTSCSRAKIALLPPSAYRQILHHFDLVDETTLSLPLTGGKAFPKPRPARRGPTPVSGDQRPRILITAHVDLSVRFWDVSTSVLWGVKPDGEDAEPFLTQDYPRPLRHLDVDLRTLLSSPDVRVQELKAARVWRERPWELEIDQVELAGETLEMAITLSTGETLIWRFAYGEHRIDLELDRVEAESGLDHTVHDALQTMSLGQDQPPSAAPSPSPGGLGGQGHPNLEAEDLFVDLSGAPVPHTDHDGFRPVGAVKSTVADDVTLKRCLALSNIGFLALSSGADLVVLDLRGPEVLHFESPKPTAPSGRSKSKKPVEGAPIASLTWSICPVGNDHDRSPRLLVTDVSGLTRIFEMANVGGAWHVSSEHLSISHDSTRGVVASFVIDKGGDEMLANSQNLQLAEAYQSRPFDAALGPSSLWIVLNRTTISCYFNIDGPKTAEFTEEREWFESAAIVRQQGCAALAVQSRHCAMHLFSLPDLQQITRFKFDTTLHDSAGTFALSRDGDFVQYLDPLNVRLGTVRDLYRPDFPPRVELFDPSKPVPVQTSAIASFGSVLGTWFGGRKVYTGAEMETILGGPNRPPSKPRAATGDPPPLATTSRRELNRKVSGPTGSGAAGAGGNRAAKESESWFPSQTEFVQGAGDSARDAMARTNAALEQRGEYLQNIQERLGSALDDAAKFAQETKRTAQQEAAKKSIAGGFSSLWNKIP